MRINPAALESHLIEHHITAIRKLNGKQIPAGLLRRQLVSCPFAIKPGATFHRVRFSADLYRARRIQSGDRIIVGCMSGPIRLLAQPVFALEYRRSFGGQLQLDRVILGGSLQPKYVTEIKFPVVDPRQSIAVSEAGLTIGAAADPAIKMEFGCTHIGYREVSELQIIHNESRSSWAPNSRRSVPEAKKCE